MCGIAGILSQGAAAPPSQADLSAMIGSLRHRGPDGVGFYCRDEIGFAHSRLSIIDLASGDQPIHNEDQSVWVTFNGEIFNYVELRAELERKGHRFYTQSDTEVIVHLYEDHGEDFVAHLNGQFAIALWDETRQRLVLARDRVGIRPLFYCLDRNQLLFASEVKALAAGGATLTLDPVGLGEAFTFWSAVDPQTPFRNVRSLPPGHLLVCENGRQSAQRYWQWTPRADRAIAQLSFEEAAGEVRKRLVEAVRLQLRADVPVGAYLSGGLDSSGIVSLVRNYTRNRVRTFSVAFEEAEFDESESQAAMVRYLNTEHVTVRCSRRQIGERFPQLIWHTETPIVRTAPVPLMMLSGLVRESGYRVVLTGEGADEVFAGYDIFKEAKIRRFWARQPESKWRSSLFGRLYGYLKHSPVGNAQFASSFFGAALTDLANPAYAHGSRWGTTRRIWNFFTPATREALAGRDVQAAMLDTLPAEFAGWDGLSRDQYLESKTLLSGYLLSSQGDRVAMANSIEGRVPFLDHELIEFANALPARYKLRGLEEKAVLRAALSDALPADIIRRTKQPYRAPDSASFFENSQPLPYVSELLSPAALKRAGYFDPALVQRLVEKCRQGRAIGFADNQAFVGILSTMLVHEMFVEGRERNFDTSPAVEEGVRIESVQ